MGTGRGDLSPKTGRRVDSRSVMVDFVNLTQLKTKEKEPPEVLSGSDWPVGTSEELFG